MLELMIVVAVIAILAAIALPSYRDYVMRANLVDGTHQLAAYRAQMEQFYQDARTYATTGNYTSPCDNLTSAYANWSFSCNNTQTAAAYTITATGKGIVAGFVYTINQNNAQATSTLGANWPGAPATCWIVKRGGTC